MKLNIVVENPVFLPDRENLKSCLCFCFVGWQLCLVFHFMGAVKCAGGELRLSIQLVWTNQEDEVCCLPKLSDTYAPSFL